jgi:hypothetical protein
MLALQKCARNVSQELTTWVCNVSETEAIHVSYCIAHIPLIIEFIDSDVAHVIPMLRLGEIPLSVFSIQREDKSRVFFICPYHIILSCMVWERKQVVTYKTNMDRVRVSKHTHNWTGVDNQRLYSRWQILLYIFLLLVIVDHSFIEMQKCFFCLPKFHYLEASTFAFLTPFGTLVKGYWVTGFRV